MVLLDSSKRDDNSSPHLLTIVARSSSKVLPSGIESSTSPEPIILLRYRIVRTLTVINAKLGIMVLAKRKGFLFINYQLCAAEGNHR